MKQRAVAKLVSRLDGVQEVAGSSPVSPTKKNTLYIKEYF